MKTSGRDESLAERIPIGVKVAYGAGEFSNSLAFVVIVTGP